MCAMAQSPMYSTAQTQIAVLSFNKQSVLFKVNKLVADLFGVYSQVYSFHWGGEHEYFWRRKEAEEPEYCFGASCMYF